MPGSAGPSRSYQTIGEEKRKYGFHSVDGQSYPWTRFIFMAICGYYYEHCNLYYVYISLISENDWAANEIKDDGKR